MNQKMRRRLGLDPSARYPSVIGPTDGHAIDRFVQSMGKLSTLKIQGAEFSREELQEIAADEIARAEANLGPQEPPQDASIFNRRQPDGVFRPVSEFFDLTSMSAEIPPAPEPTDAEIDAMVIGHVENIQKIAATVKAESDLPADVRPKDLDAQRPTWRTGGIERNAEAMRDARRDADWEWFWAGPYYKSRMIIIPSTVYDEKWSRIAAREWRKLGFEFRKQGKYWVREVPLEQAVEETRKVIKLFHEIWEVGWQKDALAKLDGGPT